MDPVTLIVGGLTVTAGVAAAQLWLSDRQWVSTWRGHRVLVRHHKGRVVVDIDGQTVLSQGRLFLRKRYREPWQHPEIGDAAVTLTKQLIGGHGDFTLSMTIGEEQIPLVELERNWRGARMLVGLQTVPAEAADECWERLSHTAVEPLGDARWLAACRLLSLTRQSAAMTDELRETANLLQGALRRGFEARLRLGDESMAALGEADADLLVEARAAVEVRISEALEAVKSLHMAVVSIEAHADETAELRRVHKALEHLDAEDEVERFLKRHQQQATTR